MDAISKIKDSAYIGTDGLFATDALISYKQQLEGLTVTQQKMALMGTNLSEAQRNQVLQFIAATAATKTLTAEQVLSCTADEKQILVKAGLIAEEQLEKGSTIELTEEKLKEILANEALSVSDKNIILNKFGVTGANLTEASSWGVLGKSIAKATLEKLKWLATTPEGWATLAVAAIVGAIAAYVKWGATLENTREKLEDLKSECDTITSEIESVNGELETTKQRLEELAGKPSLTFTEKEEYDNLVKQNNELQRQLDLQKMSLDEKNKEKNKTFVSAMEKDVSLYDEYHYSNYSGKIEKGHGGRDIGIGTDESDYIRQQLKDYQDYLGKIADLDEQYKDDLSNKKYLKERARIEKGNEKISKYLQEKNTEFATASEGIDYIEEPKNEDEEKVNKWLDFINDFQDKMAIAMDGDNAKANAFNRVVDNWQFDDVTQGLQDLGKEGKVTADMLDDPKYDEFIKKLVELGIIDSADNLDAIALAFNNVTNSAEATANAGDKATSSLSEFEKLSDNIGKLSSAYKELADNGYIAIKTINELQTATGLSGDEWAEYETKLLNAKKGSAEFNQVMSDLTYKMIENQVKIDDLTNATDEEVKAIENKIAATLRENGVTNASAVAHDYVAREKARVTAKNFELSDSIDDNKNKLTEEAEACGVSTAAYAQLVAQETIFNNNTLDISDKVAKLAALQQSLGQTTSAAISLNNALAGQTLDNRLETAVAMQEYGIKNNGHGYEYNGVTYTNGKEALNAAMMEDFKKNLKIDIPKPDYSGTLSSSGKSEADKIKDLNEKIADTQEQLEDLAKSEALDAIKYKFDQIEQSIEKISTTISLLDSTLNLTPETDYVGRIEITSRQMGLAQQKASMLKNEFNQLKATEYTSADAAEELANRMKSVADELANNTKEIIEYNRQITEYYMSALNSISGVPKDTLDEAMNFIDRNIKALSEGSLTGLTFSLSPVVPESAYEQQREENESIEREMQEHYEAVAAMQTTALDMQYQEQVADNQKKKSELVNTLEEARTEIANLSGDVQQTQTQTNAATSAEQQTDDANKEAETQRFSALFRC